jgi:arylsulfatase A-like enzyme
MEEQEIKSSTFRAHRLPKEQPLDKPNVLILMTDQQRYDTIGAAGFSYMQTPHLDRLVREGCLYRFGCSPNPICLPARHNLLTGLPAREHGFPDNLFGVTTRTDLPTLPRILSDNRYETRAIGKMHFKPPRRHNGFDKMDLMEELPFYREQDEYAMYLQAVGLGHIQNIHGVRNLLYMVPQRSLIPEEHHGTTWVGDRAVDFIRTNRGRHPFFLWVSWIAPHPPFDVPDTFADLYRNADLPQPYLPKTPLSALSQESRMLGDLPTPAYVRRMRELYYAQISLVDKNIGKILESLEEIGQLDNTLIFFVSDHGEMLGDHGLYQKWLPYDSCARIPFIVRYPRQIAPGTICDDFVDLNDVLPTVLEVAGLIYPTSHTLPGESLVSKERRKDRRWQYMEYGRDNRRWISIRDKTYKYNYYYGGAHEELFDMVNDPHETTNLLANGVPANLVCARGELRRRLVEYERVWGLEGYTCGGDLKRGAPYSPHPQRNEAFPRFPSKITDPLERSQMNRFLDEVLAVVAKEPVVRLRDLDIASWQQKAGLTDDEVRRLLEADDHRHVAGGS